MATESWLFDGYERVRPADGPQDGSNDICHVYRKHDKLGPLIAAAPDLLAACKTVIDVIECLGVEKDVRKTYRLGKPTLDELRAAIAKAEAAS